MAAYIDLRREAENAPADPSSARIQEGRQLEVQRKAAEAEAWQAVARRAVA